MKATYIVGGRKKFADLDGALEYAQQVWVRTGVILAVEAV